MLLKGAMLKSWSHLFIMSLITTLLPPNFCPNVTFTRHSRTEGQKISEAKGSLHGDYQQMWHLLSEQQGKTKSNRFYPRPNWFCSVSGLTYLYPYYLKPNTQHDVTILNSWRVIRISLQLLSTVSDVQWKRAHFCFTESLSTNIIKLFFKRTV